MYASKASAKKSDKQEVEKICDLFRILGNSLDLGETLSSFDRELRRLLVYEAISLHVVENGRLLPAYAAGEEFATLASLEASLGEGFLGLAAGTRRPALNCRPDKVCGLGLALVIPLDHGGAVTSVLALYHDGSRAFSAADLDTLLAVAPKLAAAVENARTHQAAAQLAGFDPLTGALNARAMFQRLDAELARTRRLREPLAVLQCTIEGLDESEPALSRRVLRQVAAGLREGCREYDAVAWTGGDFVLVLAGFTPADLEEKRERIQRAVEEVGFSAGLPLAAGVGAAFFPEDAPDAEGLLAAAAERLQEARRVAPGMEEEDGDVHE